MRLFLKQQKAKLGVLAVQLLCLSLSQAILDTNANGLSDVWEKHYNATQLFSSANPIHAPTADPDRDGWTNAQEALAGTHPFDGSMPTGKTNLRITPVIEAYTYELTWPVIPGKSYLLQASTNLHTWITIGPTIKPGYYESEYAINIEAADPNATTTSPPPKLFWRINIKDRDEDSDSLTTTEEYELGTTISHNDSDYDGLPDHWELSYGMDPSVPFTQGSDDPDLDGVTHRDEYLLGFNPLAFTPNALTLDRDNDGMPDVFESRTATYRWNDLRNQQPYQRKLDWEVADGHLDFDKDNLSNIAEYTLTTDPIFWDSDRDLLPDGWEVAHTLNAKSSVGNHGAQGDLDGYGLSNIDELTHGTNPNKTDTDGDGSTDKEEVDRGSDPTKNTGNAPLPSAWEFIDVPFTVGDPSDSESEMWKMIIQEDGPYDTRRFELVSPTYGEMGSITLKLRKWNRYTISIEHISTAEYQTTGYDWEAQVDAKPSSVSEAETSEVGSNNYFTVKDHWLVDNRQAVFTKEKHGGNDNLVSGKKAYLIPIVIHDVGNKSKMYPTGTDDVSVTANPTSGGYKPDFWIMAPQGGATYKNEMYFQIPMAPDVKLAYTSNNSTPTPADIMLHASPWLTEDPIVTWRGNGLQTSDERPTFQIGRHNTSVQLPIQVMSMKKRTVKLAIYPVKLPTSPRNVPMPDITALKTWLDATFGDQINAWFEVTYKPQTEYNYMSSDEVYGYMSSQYGTNTFSSMFNSISYTDIAYDIRILMVDLVAIASVQMHPTLPPFAIGAVGIANRGLNGAVILAGGSAVNYTLRSQQEVIETIAHEIGHIMIGFGHPDFVPTPLDIAMGETEKLTGPAPLEGTERQYRLMSSARVPGAKLLVKREWENAEEWLKINIK